MSATSEAWSDGIPRWLLGLVGVLLVAVLVAGGLVLAQRDTLSQGRRGTGTVETDALAKAIEIQPESAELRVRLGHTYQQNARYEEAVEAFDEALRLSPNNIGAQFNKGVSLMALNRDDEGEQALKAVLAQSPDHLLAAKTLGEYYRATEQYSKIPDVVAPAAVANPEMGDLHALLGLALEKAGLFEEAELEYRKALATAPDLELATQGMARVRKRAE